MYTQDVDEITCLCESCWGVTRRFHELFEMVRQSNVEKPLTQTLTVEPLLLDDADEETFYVDEYAAEASASDNDDGPISTEIEFLDVDQANIEIIAKHHNLQLNMIYNTTAKKESNTVEPAAAASPSTPSITTPPPTQPTRNENHYRTVVVTAESRPVEDAQQQQPKRSRRLKITDEINARIRAVLQTMSCELCSAEFESVDEVFAHYREQHSQSGYLRCCDYKRGSTEKLMDHIKKYHEDIPDTNAFFCYLCTYRGVHEKKFIRHLDSQHHVFGGFSEFTCDICGKM